MIANFKRNRMGTTDFDGKFEGMRKAQEFMTYAIGKGVSAKRVQIQSDTRIGYICLESGNVDLCKPVQGGAYNHHLANLNRVGKLTQEELSSLKAQLLDSAHGKAGTNGIVYVDNSGAQDVFAEIAAA